MHTYINQSFLACFHPSHRFLYLYIGIIFAEASKRCITDSNIAKGVVNAVRIYGERNSFVTELNVELGNYRKLSMSPSQWFQKTGQLYVLSSSSSSCCCSCCRYVKSGISVKCNYISTYPIIFNIVIITLTGQLLSKVTTRKPLVVGVFQDQSIEYINSMVDEVGLGK